MIDIENQVFDRIKRSILARFPKTYVTGDYVKIPPLFPCVAIVQEDNTTYAATQTSSESENHAVIMHQVDVYSNRQANKKAECKAIISEIDKIMLNLGFTRTMLRPIPNGDDATIYRMTGRYVAIVGKDNTIYRQ